jgi:hypothetical protein
MRKYHKPLLRDSYIHSSSPSRAISTMLAFMNPSTPSQLSAHLPDGLMLLQEAARVIDVVEGLLLLSQPSSPIYPKPSTSAETKISDKPYTSSPIPFIKCRWSVQDPTTGRIHECGKVIELQDHKGTNPNTLLNSHITNDPEHVRPSNANSAASRWQCHWGHSGGTSKNKCGAAPVERRSIGKHVTRGDHIFHEEWPRTECPVCGSTFTERLGTDVETLYRHCKTSHKEECKILFPFRTKRVIAEQICAPLERDCWGGQGSLVRSTRQDSHRRESAAHPYH